MASPRWQRGVSGNPAGRLRGSRNALSEAVICALLRDFRQHGQKAIAQVRMRQPAAYLKVLALLVPREHKVELRLAASPSQEWLRTTFGVLTRRYWWRAVAGLNP